MAELPDKVTILIARLSYNGYERVEIANWLAQTAITMHEHPRVEDVAHQIITGYPTPRVRNEVLETARKIGAHITVMIDDDMAPDIHARDGCIKYDPQHYPVYHDQVPFFPSALDFMLAHPGPCVVAAPYCAGPPNERVLVSRFRELESHNLNKPSQGLQLQCFTRDEAADRTGFEMVSALPTGLMAIDMRALNSLSAPWFSYEYEDSFQTKLASTEDTVFSRNLYYLGVPQYCAWGSWAAHVKTVPVGRPVRYPLDAIPDAIMKRARKAVLEEMARARPADRENAIATGYLRAMEDDPAPVEPLAE